ncbi:MAG: outer membrane protein assembly factor BamD [Syntrophales bacterium]
MKKFQGGLLLAVLTVAFVAACATMQSRWESAKSADTITAYENFLEEYPEGDAADRARVRRDELREESAWKEAEAEHTAAGYEDFRNKYPRGRYARDVDARLEKIPRTRGDDSPPAGAEKFLQRYRRGVFLDEARVTRENLSFEQAVTADTIAAYEDFLERYPTGRLADDARRRMEKLSDDHRQTEGAIPAYGGSLNRYPSGISADEARLRREKLNAVRPVSGWGTIMYSTRTINIRAKRSAASKLKGQLKTGQPVKADFLQDGWYAVFPVNQKKRNEKMALGYVYAPLLKRGPDSPGSTAAEETSAKDPPPKNRETENLPVEVKNITFKVAGDGKELLFIEFGRFYTPTVSGIEGKEPRIILEIKNASPLGEVRAAIDTGGNFIRKIRSSRDAETRAAFIVLDMAPGKSYFASQAFYEKGNIYSLEISEQTEMRLP